MRLIREPISQADADRRLHREREADRYSDWPCAQISVTLPLDSHSTTDFDMT